jgi:Gluconate 2-dehydrogenase subunit 3
MDKVSRRTILHVIGSAGGAGVFAGEIAEAQTAKPAAAAAPYRRKVFDDRQWRTVRVLCDLILPADEHSGSATQAGVPEFLDDWIAFRKDQDGTDRLEAEILGGLAWLDRESMHLFQKGFADAAPAQQKQILDRIAWPDRAAAEDRHGVAFFTRFRDLTVGGFYSSKMGVADLPYLGNKALMDWKGCDPKVWAVIEERLKNGYKGLGGEVKGE